jgi:hypothetical protein
VSLPDQLLLSDLLGRRVRCDQGLDHGLGRLGWMHPPVHRLLGWASRPSLVSSRRCMWRLDQLRGLGEGELFVRGEPAETDADTLLRLPTLLGAILLGGGREPLGQLVDAALELRTGRILHYLVARSDPRLPGGSRWRLSPERIVDQRPGEVFTALQGLEDLPLAHASLRETLLRRSRRWREQWNQESSRWRGQWQEVSGRVEERLEGWLEEPPWEEPPPSRSRRPLADDIWEDAAEEDFRQPIRQGRGVHHVGDASTTERPAHLERDVDALWPEEEAPHSGSGDHEDRQDGDHPDARFTARRGDRSGRWSAQDPSDRPIPESHRRSRPDDDQHDPWI